MLQTHTNSSSFNVALGTADVNPAFLLVAAIVYRKDNFLDIVKKLIVCKNRLVAKRN